MDDKKDNKKSSGNGEDDNIAKQIKERKKQLVKKLPGEQHETNTEMRLEIEELVEEVELLQKEAEDYKKAEEEYQDRIKRLHADYDNYRKRTLKEQLEHIKRANKDLIEKLLPVIDSFENALNIGEDLKSEGDEFLKGVRMIYEKLMETLKKEGLEVINPEGEEFNPHLCEVAVTESVEDKAEGTVLEVLRKGYKLHDYLIRPAVVKVCKKE